MLRNNDLAWFKERDSQRKGLPQGDVGKPIKSLVTRLSSPSYQAQLSSKKPQAILKVVSFAKGVKARTLLEYVTRTGAEDEHGKPADLKFGNQFHGHLKGREAVQETYKSWQKDFERKKKGAKREPRHVTHIILSASTDNSEKSSMKVDFAANDFLDQYFQEQGFEYIYVTHRDTENPHVHVVVKNYNKRTGKKFHLSKEDTFHMRQEWVKALEARGVEAVATLRRDRVEVLEKVSQGIEEIQQKETWNDRIMLRASRFNNEDRKHLLGRVEVLEERLSSFDRGISHKELGRLRSVLAKGSKKDVGRMLGSIQSGVAKNIPLIREELLSWVEGNRIPDMTLRQRKSLARKVVKMKDDVKISTDFFSKERREFMAALRDLDTSIRSKSRRDVVRSSEAVLLKAGKDIDSVRKHLSRTFLSSSSSSGGSTKAIDYSLKAADSQSKMLLSEIKDAVLSVRNSSMGRVEKKEITRQLRSQFSAAKKLRDALGSPHKLKKILEGKGKLKRLQARAKGGGSIER